jgi:hypothetical protein
MPAGTPIQVKLPDDELGALDSYRREKLNLPSRSKALRELARTKLFGSGMSPKPGATEYAQGKACGHELRTQTERPRSATNI